ncbi:DUF192 domain-containing protein [Paracoccus sp. Z330]|uniref:DUF192 domain-containing protein n=1 Tax=Paracoccus onchidii TaxID=3017813 RepID=A0ABT4ZK40_9RHOB|nr:DUF192 domain-containing protein [Paracoccus onchidii]MDB6179432.1 DUF192 domain-containing protein [Paracoccus onchidii]
MSGIDVPASCALDQVSFLTGEGIVRFQVEIADDAAERAQGLMFRENLPADQGMLFVYDSPRAVSFWMRNTLISLDLIFMDERGVIRHIHPMAKPLDETPIPGALKDDPQPERLLILEVAGGEAARQGLAIGQPMAYTGLPPEQAMWPCR